MYTLSVVLSLIVLTSGAAARGGKGAVMVKMYAGKTGRDMFKYDRNDKTVHLVKTSSNPGRCWIARLPGKEWFSAICLRHR